MIYEPTNTEYAAVTACYGTDFLKVDLAEVRKNLYITGAEFEALGLHKPTVFKVDLANRKRLAWASKHFVPQGYVREQNIIAGSLNEGQKTRAINCIHRMGLDFPLP